MKNIGLLTNGNTAQLIDVNQREYPNPYITLMEVKVTAANVRSISLPDNETFADKTIIGLFTRVQDADNSLIGKNGQNLVSKTVLNASYLQIYQNNAGILQFPPLSYFIHQGGITAPGQYVQLMIEGGISMNNSSIEITKDVAVANTVFQLFWIWAFNCNYTQKFGI